MNVGFKNVVNFLGAVNSNSLILCFGDLGEASEGWWYGDVESAEDGGCESVVVVLWVEGIRLVYEFTVKSWRKYRYFDNKGKRGRERFCISIWEYVNCIIVVDWVVWCVYDIYFEYVILLVMVISDCGWFVYVAYNIWECVTLLCIIV